MPKKYFKWFGLTLLVLIAFITYLTAFRQNAGTVFQGGTFSNSQKQPVISLEQTGSGFVSPTAIISPGQGDNRLFVVERPGTIKVFEPGRQAAPQLFLDIRSKVFESGEMGLLGLAFHPDFKTNGYFFINYIDRPQNNTVISRYRLNSATGRADASSEKVLIKFKQPFANHNGGDLVFGPDGYLYIAVGDGGSQGDPQNFSQNKNSLLGKLLRIDVNNGEPYSSPASNPFAKESGAKPEIWALGLRNPWRISFDKSTNELYIADVGQDQIEEVNVQRAGSRGGENYGWRCYEGTRPYNTKGCNQEGSYIKPLFEYDHGENRCSITGGYVYRGGQFPALQGKYFYGDFCSGQLFYGAKSSNGWRQVLAAKTSYAISAFGQDQAGEIYLADFNGGGIYKIKNSAKSDGQ